MADIWQLFDGQLIQLALLEAVAIVDQLHRTCLSQTANERYHSIGRSACASLVTCLQHKWQKLPGPAIQCLVTSNSNALSQPGLRENTPPQVSEVYHQTSSTLIQPAVHGIYVLWLVSIRVQVCSMLLIVIYLCNKELATLLKSWLHQIAVSTQHSTGLGDLYNS